MKKFIIFTLLLFMFSCSQTPKEKATREYFVTHILADGTKMFSYVLERSNNNQRKTKGRKRRSKGSFKAQNRTERSGQSYRKEGDQRNKSRFYKRLDGLLSHKNYCREGYVELNSSFNRQRSEIKGQCNEKANENDKMTFKNQ